MKYISSFKRAQCLSHVVQFEWVFLLLQFFSLRFAPVLFVKPQRTVSARSCFDCTHYFFRLFLLLFALYLQNRIASLVHGMCLTSVFIHLSGRPSKIKSRGRKNERNNNSTIPTRQPKKEDHKLRLFSCKVNLVKCPLFLPILRVKQIQF